jgi:tripartite-type tricarboxylate transporter receptor subunit TctC
MLAAATRTSPWALDLERLFWTEMYLDGARLHEYLERERTDMRRVLDELGLLAGAGGG